MSFGVDLDKLYADSEFLSSEQYLSIANDLNYNYLKRDFLFKSGVWRESKVRSISRAPWKFAGKNLVIGHSDIMTNLKAIRMLRLFGVSHLYGTNTIPFQNISTTLPLGLTNDCDDSPIHRILGNTRHLLRAHHASNFPSSYTGSLYVNFTASNNEVVRSQLLKLLNPLKSVEYGETDFSERGRIHYLSSLRTNSFVVCPEGNGVDTHRLWETLYMGGIPIISKSRYLSGLVSNLPVLQVDDWSQLQDEAFLESQWSTIHKTVHNFDKLKSSYWFEVMNSKNHDND